MKKIQIFIVIFLVFILRLQSQNIPNIDKGNFIFNQITYNFDREEQNSLSVYNSQNLVANPGLGMNTPNHSYYNVQGGCTDKIAYTDRTLIVQALKNVFPPARRQELINEAIALECLLHRPTHKIKEVSFILQHSTGIRREEIYQLEMIIKSQNHVQNLNDLWCPNLEYYYTSDDAIYFRDIL